MGMLNAGCLGTARGTTVRSATDSSLRRLGKSFDGFDVVSLTRCAALTVSATCDSNLLGVLGGTAAFAEGIALTTSSGALCFGVTGRVLL